VGTVHVPPAADDAEQILWTKQTRDKARPVKWSCPEHRPEYELCVYAALWFVRRDQMYETVRGTRDEAEHLWSLLIAGAAR
jgi:hypothetical protein